MGQRINLYFSTSDEIRLYERVKAYAEQRGLSLSKAAFALLQDAQHELDEQKRLSDELMGLRDQVIRDLRKRLLDLETELETAWALLEISDPKSRDILLRAIRHGQEVRKIERTEGPEAAMEYHLKHKGKKK